MACGAWLPDGLSSDRVTLPAFAVSFAGLKKNGVAPFSPAARDTVPPAPPPLEPPEAGVDVVSAGGAAAGVELEDELSLLLSLPQAATKIRQPAPSRSGR